MSEPLSRVRSRQKQYKGEGLPTVKEKNGNPLPLAAVESEAPVPVPGALSRKARQSLQQAAKKPKHAVGHKEGEETPSRAQSYPSERIRFSKMFVNSLIVIFVMLLVFLLWWGIEGAPKLSTLWQ